MNQAYLLLGSNQGEREEFLLKAKEMLEIEAGEILKESSVYRTAAWGDLDQPDFLNQVVLISTQLHAADLLDSILGIEKKIGRIRTVKNAARVIDIDILFFNKELINQPGLTIPHPHIQDRRFVLVPLVEIAAGYEHPVLKKSVLTLLEICQDDLAVLPV